MCVNRSTIHTHTPTENNTPDTDRGLTAVLALCRLMATSGTFCEIYEYIFIFMIIYAYIRYGFTSNKYRINACIPIRTRSRCASALQIDVLELTRTNTLDMRIYTYTRIYNMYLCTDAPPPSLRSANSWPPRAPSAK